MGTLSELELWDKYQTELRDIYDRKKKIKPIYPLFHLIKDYYKKESLPIQKCIAEVGFGNGGLLESLSSTFISCYGLDISPKNIQFTEAEFRKKNIQNVCFEVYNILESPKKSNYFDAIVLSHVLEHFSHTELELVLKNVKTMLKKDGIFFGATPYMKPFNQRICPNCSHTFEIDGHKQIFNEEKMKALLENNGFYVDIIRHFNPQHFYYGESLLFILFNKIIGRKNVTQLEFVTRLKY